MGGRFGKYGDTKRKARMRQSGFITKKGEKVTPDPKGRGRGETADRQKLVTPGDG
ncbi:MAG: hypothetical protein WBM69_02705 [Desulfobacterales bacterium]